MHTHPTGLPNVSKGAHFPGANVSSCAASKLKPGWLGKPTALCLGSCPLILCTGKRLASLQTTVLQQALASPKEPNPREQRTQRPPQPPPNPFPDGYHHEMTNPAMDWKVSLSQGVLRVRDRGSISARPRDRAGGTENP